MLQDTLADRRIGRMEESDLMKERLQAITNKHRIQEEIRQKKLELDQEKLKLQHLKKKSLREQWLLQDSASHNATNSKQQQGLLSDRQQTRALQVNIHRIEMEVESLEREESMISTNEGFILNRLKAVEKSSEDIIKEAQDNFVHEPLQVTTVIPDVPECLSPPATKYSESSTPRKTLFAMEINVTKNLLTGESTVLSTATVPTEELNKHTGLKVFDDGRKCVYALNSQEGSCDKRSVSELSASEVEQLLRSASVHRQLKPRNYHQNHGRKEEPRFYNSHDERNVRHQRGPYGNHVRNNMMDKDFNCRQNWSREHGVAPSYGHKETSQRRQEERNNQSNFRESHRRDTYRGFGHHYGNQEDSQSRLHQVNNSVHEDQPASICNNGLSRSNSVVNGGRANGYLTPISHDQKVVSPCQPQLCYTPLNHIPLRDYISVDEEELYCLSPPSCHSHGGNPVTALYSSSTHSDRVPSPLFGDDTPYTILNTVDTTEPITAIFMGFQTAQDDSGQTQEFEGSLKAELIIIEDNDDCDDVSAKDKKSKSCPTGRAANGDIGQLVVGDRWTERGVASGIRKMKNKHKACCTVC